MTFFTSAAGLTPAFRSPPDVPGIVDEITEEAAVCPPAGPKLHVTPLVAEGEAVAQGGAVACLRHAPDVCFVAPVAGRVAHQTLLQGRRLSEIVLFREGAEVVQHDPARAGTTGGLRRLMQAAGLWPWLRRRPFGGMPAHDETPVAIVVMATDTRPFAPDPARALDDREEDFARGLYALARLTSGPVIVCGDAPMPQGAGADRLRCVSRGTRHPQGSAGICIHALCPAGLDAPVWDIHAEDAAALGTLLETGEVPMLRRVHIAGAHLREARMVRTHPGADLRQLTQRIAAPGPHVLMSGAPLDGHVAKWLAPRHRQVTVLPRAAVPRKPHWLVDVLTQSPVARPAIPTAALTQALGGVLPAAAFVRALGAGDDETAMKLGLLSLLEEDVALADYVLSETGHLTGQLRAMLERIRKVFTA